MPIKWTVSFSMMFLLLTIISGAMEMTYVTDAETSVFWSILHPELGSGPGSSLPGFIGDIVGTITSVFTVVIDWVYALFHMFTFDYAMFQGPWIVARLFFLSISVGGVVSLVMAIRGTSSG